MISLELAKQLKDNGLIWEAKLYDFFAIPDRGFDDRVFVITDMMSSLNLIRGWPAITFHGAVEWALDYILTTEVVWLPTEEQLRRAIVEYLAGKPDARIALEYANNQYNLKINWQVNKHIFQAGNANDVYANGLLHLLREDQQLH